MSRRTLLAVCGALAAALGLGGLLGGAPAASRGSSPVTASASLADRALTGAAASIGAAATQALEEQVRARPGDASALTELGLAYQLRWRETADASYLPRSEEALRRARRASPQNANVLLGLGSLALIRHEFRSALAYGRRAQRLLPGSYRPYGVVGDALVELGRYGEAFDAFDRMASLRPGLASYARVAYARELTGDRRGALSAMRLALESAAGQPEPTAWALVELSKLELALGDPRGARRDAAAALRAVPGYPSARVQLALVHAASGDLRAAVRSASLASTATPTAQAVTLLADLLERSGRAEGARRQRATVAVIERLLAASGVRVDLESAVYRADHLVDPEKTVELARRARAERPSIYGDDALGWALARAGRCEQALPWLERSLRLGTQDGLLFFHRGYAAGCAGRPAEMRRWYARALAANPAFSVRWAPVARAALSR